MNRSIRNALLGLSVVGLLSVGPAQADGHKDAAGMTMHHMHMMVNHALEMAVEGSNMVMLGEMNMAEGVDELTIKHGKMMIQHAKDLIKEVMEGEAMHKLHHGGSTTEGDKMMSYTHDLADSALNHIKLLEGMSDTSGMASGMHKHKH